MGAPEQAPRCMSRASQNTKRAPRCMGVLRENEKRVPLCTIICFSTVNRQPAQMGLPKNVPNLYFHKLSDVLGAPLDRANVHAKTMDRPKWSPKSARSDGPQTSAMLHGNAPAQNGTNATLHGNAVRLRMVQLGLRTESPAHWKQNTGAPKRKNTTSRN